MGIKDEVGKIEYHYGFYGAVHAEYEPTHVKMEYLQEHELGEEPVRMDMLLLKLEDTPLTDPIGSFFRAHNVLEYKSPEDRLTVSAFYKAQGYALLYKGMEKTVDAIPLEQVTVTLFHDAYPRRMFRMLEERGMDIAEVHPGVYRVTGPLSVHTQVVVTSRLPKGEYSAFKALAKNASKDDIISLLGLADSNHPQMVDYVRAVLNVSIIINEKTIEEIKEAGIMPEAVRRVFQEEFKQERDEGRMEGRMEGREEERQVIFERMKAANIPEDQARAIAFG
ncbi:MAG: hypothetical protein K6C12_13800 [Oscillospiraceae bacterium]|nr:hypothetical protein [Oscillospiraceae bacterium]